MRQPLFNRTMSFVAVRHIRMSSETVLEPGTPIEGLRVFHLKDLYRRRKIGPVGHPWTESMLANTGKLHRPELAAISHDEPKAQVPGAVEPFMHQDEEGNWVLGDGQVFGSLDEALAAWHNSVGTEDPTDSADEPGDDETGTDQDETTKTEATEADQDKKSEPAEAPEPVKVGSQWTIAGVDGKFSSAKKAREAWDIANDPLEN